MALDTTSGTTDVEEGPSQAGPSSAPQPAVVAEVDLLIERPDLGPGCTTVVVAGDPISRHLMRLPSRPYAASAVLGKAKGRGK